MRETIKMLGEMAVDEASGAHKYAKLAVENKFVHPKMAEAVSVMATQELGHADTLLTTAHAIMNECKTSGKSTPEELAATEYLFEYLKEKHDDLVVATKVCLEKYKTMTT